ncbi:MAG: epoxide hydrolase, partial [Gammaproteobacteria bacterium]|nr:epoxide hydrolase [Gammaproteobacteria bacterium]
MTTIEPFAIDMPAADIDNLKSRLAQTRWPDAETPDDWSQGVPLAYAQEFCRYWAESYDWSARQALMNRFAQFKTTIEDIELHFIHHRSPSPQAKPLLITHGWPGSVVEFHKVIEPLADPAPPPRGPAGYVHRHFPPHPPERVNGQPPAPPRGGRE